MFWPILLLYFIALFFLTMKRQIKHMIKHRYVPWSWGKTKFQVSLRRAGRRPCRREISRPNPARARVERRAHNPIVDVACPNLTPTTTPPRAARGGQSPSCAHISDPVVSPTARQGKAAAPPAKDDK